MSNKESKFNWKLRKYGVIGLCVGFVAGLVIWDVMLSTLRGVNDLIFINAIWGIVIGAIGGAALGLALKDKKKILYLSCAGAIGFSIGFAILHVWYSFGFHIVGAVMGAIVGAALGLALKDKKKILYLSCAGAIGFALGFSIWSSGGFGGVKILGDSIVGAIGGAIIGGALGLALKDKKKILYLSCTGAIGFSIGFTIANTFWHSIRYLIFGALIGSIIGAALGLTLAYLTKDGENKDNIQGGCLESNMRIK